MTEIADPRSEGQPPDEGHNDLYEWRSDPDMWGADDPQMGPLRRPESQVEPPKRHPYVPYKCSPVRRITNGTPDSFPLDFKANSVRVDNYSPQFLYIDSANFWVPPGTVGWVLKCVQASDEGRAYWAAPAGVVQPAAVTGALAVLMWLEEELDFQTGIELTTVAVSTVTGAAAGGASLGAPPAADVLDGGSGLQSGAGTTTIITVPAGRTWIGTVGVSITGQNPPVTATGTISAGIQTVGAGATPAAGTTYVGADVILDATVAGALQGANGFVTTQGPLTVIAPVGNSVNVSVVVGTSGTVTNLGVRAWATGLLQ